MIATNENQHSEVSKLMTGRVALVTGASRGIGAATAFQPQEQKDAIAQMIPLRRNGLPEDVASAILLLACEEARFITGAYLPVSGGIQML
jgi:NAD(P)-dependent dehydrogenase (short-subunit alcohol dehydrogenase family)